MNDPDTTGDMVDQDEHRRPDTAPEGRPVLFVGVGAPRSGTTWLADRLGEHPQIAMSPVKEMHWFDAPRKKQRFDRLFAERCQTILSSIERGHRITELQAALLRRVSLMSDDDYVGYLASWRSAGQTAFGEFTPSYATLGADDFARIAAVHDPTRFIFVMRNPVDRMWSHYRRLVTVGQLGADDLARGELPAEHVRHFRQLSDYRATLENVWRAVPRHDVFTCFYEDLTSADEGPAVLSALWRFLEVGDAEVAESTFRTRTNTAEASDLDEAQRRRLADMLGDVYRWAATEFDLLPESWRADLELDGS